MSWIYGFVVLLALVVGGNAEQSKFETPGQKRNWMFQSEGKWEREWKNGMWEFLETIPIERSRISVIGSVLIPAYTPANGSVLDIGCGEGAIADFLNPERKANYVGIDLASEAINLAIKKRGAPMKFVHAAAHTYVPDRQFDAIVFSEVLYYVNYAKILMQYEQALTANGIFIISIFYQPNLPKYENIFNFARERYEYVDEMYVEGYTRKSRNGNREKTSFRVEVFRKKPSQS